MGLLLLVTLILAVAMHYGAFGDRWASRFRRAMAPGANQGPLLGIFITGPLGFLAGLAWGVFRAATDSD